MLHQPQSINAQLLRLLGKQTAIFDELRVDAGGIRERPGNDRADGHGVAQCDGGGRRCVDLICHDTSSEAGLITGLPAACPNSLTSRPYVSATG